jgi:hypothetical protein
MRRLELALSIRKPTIRRMPFASAASLLALVFAMSTPVPGIALNADQRALPASETLAPSTPTPLPILRASQSLVLEDRQGYDSEYLFGMTRGVVNSTLMPALKPLAFLVTVPLDLALLPFTAIAGLF